MNDIHIPPLDGDETERQFRSAFEKGTAGRAARRERGPKAGGAAGPFEELDAMIGCQEAKRGVCMMIAQHRMGIIAEKRGKPASAPHLHCVFTGPSGTCKSTVAELYARILHQMGVTPSDRFAEVTRAVICGAYVGHTAKNVKALFRDMKGGTIFIDEAYSLNDGDSSSYGAEAINELIVGMENNPDTVVIFTGYEDLMEEFLDANPGLRSRIPFHIRFPAYSTEELLKISDKMAQDRGYFLTDAARLKLWDILSSARTDPAFGNGRYCRNLIEEAIGRKSFQLGVLEKDLSAFFDRERYPNETLFSLDETCFEEVSPLTGDLHRKKLGF